MSLKQGLQSSDSSHLSITQSQEEPAAAAATAATSTATAPSSTTTATTTSTLAVPIPSSRVLSRTQSAGEASKPQPASSSSSPPPSPSMSSKRSRFLLKRQDCLEKGIDLTMDSKEGAAATAASGDTGGSGAESYGSSLPVPQARPTVVKSSPNSPLMGYPHGGIGSPDFQPQSSADTAGSSSSAVTAAAAGPTLVKQRSQPLPGETIFSPSSSPLHGGLEHQRPLPSVRVIPDASCASPPGAPGAEGRGEQPVPNMRLLCPPDAAAGGGGGGAGGGRLVKSRSTDSSLGTPYSPFSSSGEFKLLSQKP